MSMIGAIDGSADVGWARDLPAEVHGPDNVPVVTTPTPAHLYCMRMLEISGKLDFTDSTAEVRVLVIGLSAVPVADCRSESVSNYLTGKI